MNWLTVKEAADRLRVSPGLVYKWCEAGELAHSRFGKAGCRGTIRIDATILEDFAREQCQPTTKPVKTASAYNGGGRFTQLNPKRLNKRTVPTSFSSAG